MPEGSFPTTHLPHGVRLAAPFACACCFSVGETARHAAPGAAPVRSGLSSCSVRDKNSDRKTA